MRPSAHKHLDDVLFEYGERTDQYAKRREYLRSLLTNGGGDKVQCSHEQYEAEKYVDLLTNDRVLKALLRYIEPVNDALSHLTPEQRNIIECWYVFRMPQDAIMQELGITNLTSYYRAKKAALEAVGRKLFGVFA